MTPEGAAELPALRASLRRTQLLLRITEGLTGAVTTSEIDRSVTDALRDHLDALFVGVATLDRSDGHDDVPRLRFVDLDAVPTAVRTRWSRYPLERYAPATAAVRSRVASFYATRAEADAVFPGFAGEMASAGSHAMATLPLLVEEEVLGALCVAWDHPRVIEADTRAMLTVVAGNVAHALHRIAARAAHHGVDAAPAPAGSDTGQLCGQLAATALEFDAALDNPAVTLLQLQHLDGLHTKARRRHDQAHGPEHVCPAVGGPTDR